MKPFRNRRAAESWIRLNAGGPCTVSLKSGDKYMHWPSPVLSEALVQGLPKRGSAIVSGGRVESKR
jgi:hypothetical protein